MTDKTTNDEKVMRSIAVSKETWEKLKVIAQENHRSVSGHVAFILDEVVAEVKADG